MDDDFRVIGPIYSQRKAEEWHFVLRAVGLEGWLRRASFGEWQLVLPASQAARAMQELQAYEDENRQRRLAPAHKDRPLYASSPWAVFISALLVGFFALTGPASSHSVWFQKGIADAGRILHGSWYQMLTALTLHADAQHLLGNVLVGTLFLALVHRRLGAGLGTLLVVLAGAAGNGLNALWHHGMHRSLGASTAVMAALGVLTASQLVLQHTTSRKRWLLEMFGPLAGGLVLLGTFGASPHSDFHAHGFGFLSGLVLGLVAAFPLRKRQTPLSRWLQGGLGLTGLALVLGAWSWALTLGH